MKNLVFQKNQVYQAEKPRFSKKPSFSPEKPSFSEKLGFSNSGDFRVRKIACSKMHSVLPINENGFRSSEVSYNQSQSNQFLKGGILNSWDPSPRIQSYAEFGTNIYFKRPASSANGEYNKLGMI